MTPRDANLPQNIPSFAEATRLHPLSHLLSVEPHHGLIFFCPFVVNRNKLRKKNRTSASLVIKARERLLRWWWIWGCEMSPPLSSAPPRSASELSVGGRRRQRTRPTEGQKEELFRRCTHWDHQQPIMQHDRYPPTSFYTLWEVLLWTVSSNAENISLWSGNRPRINKVRSDTYLPLLRVFSFLPVCPRAASRDEAPLLLEASHQHAGHSWKHKAAFSFTNNTETGNLNQNTWRRSASPVYVGQWWI